MNCFGIAVRAFRSIVCSSVLMLFLAPFTFAQTSTTADALGVVTDSSGGVVPAATVTIKSLDSGEARSEVANAHGEYRFSLLKPGIYEVSAITPGLQSNLSKIELLVGQAHEVNLVMNPKGTSTTVEVTASVGVLQKENADRESNFNKAQVDDLPAPGGDLTTLAYTAPGIVINVKGGSGNITVNGIAGTTTLYTLDGMDQNDPANNLNNSGSSNNLLGANAVGEVAVITNAYSPQFGRYAGAQVSMTGLTGANAFHGNVFNNYNFEKLNANSFFANEVGTPRSRADAHQFGGRIGGRIIKNKLFFFFDDENLRYVVPGQGDESLPSPQLQAYTLAHVGAAELPLYQDYFALMAQSPQLGRGIPVVNGTGPLQDNKNHMGCEGTNGTFAGTPTGTGGTFGVDTSCAVAFGYSTAELNHEQQRTFRLDYNLGSNTKISAKWLNDVGIQATGASPVNPLYNTVSNQPSDQEALTVSTVITPSVVNTLQASVLWYTALFGVADFAKTSALMPDSIGIGDGGANSAPFATVGNGAFPNGRNVGHIQLNDDLSWSHGRHTFKFGVAARYDQYTYTSIASGAFLGSYSLGDLSDFANGKLGFTNNSTFSSFSERYTPYAALHFVFPASGFYASDDWNITKNLKLNLGLRVEVNFNPTCKETCFSETTVPANSSGYSASAATPYNQTLQERHNLFYDPQGGVYEPRVGFAYSPTGMKNTVIRGGIGLFTNTYTDGLGGTLAAQPPNSFTPSSLNYGTVGMASDPNSSATNAQISATAFFKGFAAGNTLAQIQSAVAPAKFTTPSISSYPNSYDLAHTLEWNFEIQQQFTSHDSISVNYVANKSWQLSNTINLNEFACTVVVAYCTAANSLKYYGGAYGGLPTAPLDPRFVSVTQTVFNGRANFNSLTILLRHAFAYGLTGQFHYSFGHALGTNGYENPFNLQGSYGSLATDIRHQAVGDLLWNQPFKTGNKFVNQIVVGWTVGLKAYFYSGQPFSVTDSNIASHVNTTGVTTGLADLLTSSETHTSCNGTTAVNGNSCLNKLDFATYSTAVGVPGTAGQPIQLDWGNVSPNSFLGPHYLDFDTQMSRNFTIKERVTLMLGAMSTNVANHPNFGNPSGSLTSNSFGQITGTVQQPTSIYGTGQGASTSGRVVVFIGRISF
jgi:hypothetical protein